ncbi:MAG: penicillin-binding protein activator [Burkholderiales bacterium]|nr:penicillin-binding protein activator [Burkholderiales bacterium]
MTTDVTGLRRPGIVCLAAAWTLACAWPALCGAQAAPASEPGFIALLLPLSSPDFAAPAEALASGCRSALEISGAQAALQLSRTDASPQGIVAAYESALQRGAALVVGPMTRDGVSALARSYRPGVPVLALNAPEDATNLPPGFFALSLSAQSEARLVARMAFSAELKSATVLQSGTALGRRLAQAFTREWQGLGGRIADTRAAGSPQEVRAWFDAAARGALNDAAARGATAAAGGMAFLAGEAGFARTLRPQLPRALHAFATSLVNDSADTAGNADLEGLRFVDMPWLLQPDHPAVMIYPRPAGLSVLLQRFYALGIDACRLAPMIATRARMPPLDGVTGVIGLGAGNVLERLPLPAMFRSGVAVPEPMR